MNNQYRKTSVNFENFDNTLYSISINKIKCNLCNDIITSDWGHDFKFCKCGESAVDGGKDYLRRLGDNYTEMSELIEKISCKTISPVFITDELREELKLPEKDIDGKPLLYMEQYLIDIRRFYMKRKSS